MAVTDEAIEKIKGMIVSGALCPGDRLPKESELAAELGLSRNSLREAVRALSLIRILDVRQGDGTYVTSLDPQLLLEALGFVVDFHRDDTVLEFLAVRRILEPAATAMAASRIGEEQLDALGDDPSVEELVACDLEFHRGIARGCGNSVLCSLLDGLSGPTTGVASGAGWPGGTRSAVPCASTARPSVRCATGTRRRRGRGRRCTSRAWSNGCARPGDPSEVWTGGRRGRRGRRSWVFEGLGRGSDPFTPPCKGAAGAPAERRKVGGSGEGTSEGGAG